MDYEHDNQHVELLVRKGRLNLAGKMTMNAALVFREDMRSPGLHPGHVLRAGLESEALRAISNWPSRPLKGSMVHTALQNGRFPMADLSSMSEDIEELFRTARFLGSEQGTLNIGPRELTISALVSPSPFVRNALEYLEINDVIPLLDRLQVRARFITHYRQYSF